MVEVRARTNNGRYVDEDTVTPNSRVNRRRAFRLIDFKTQAIIPKEGIVQ